jgi:hypothetical protein
VAASYSQLKYAWGQMMSTQAIQERKRELKARRKPLFDRYVKNPSETSLVLEIKIVDDEIAECNQQIDRQRTARN